MEFKIEKGVPLTRKNARGYKYPFAQMEVGDSIFVGAKEKPSASVSVSRYQKESGKVFVRRTVDGGLRIWRVK